LSYTPLRNRIADANSLLAPYAVPINGVLGREYDEIEDDTRFPFQRDRDRILHTQAFRRLKGKTQVFVTGEGDHYRTRLTHTLEVAQISRDMARTLQLNEDLAECIALAHDLGHPPFGHAGEDAVHEWMKQFGKNFEHNAQSHRIVTLLEYHCSAYPGLNLNKEVLHGLLKHQTTFDQAGQDFVNQSLEAQVVNIADEIAYTAHDSDDGLRENLFSLEEITTVPLAQQAHAMTTERETSLRGALIHLLVHDIYSHFDSTTPCINFSQNMNKQLSTLRTFLWDNMYLHPAVLQKSADGKEKLLELMNALHASPSNKVLSLQRKTDGTLEEAVKDYVVGMTERFVLTHEQPTP
jgi:dGTPase